MLLFARARGFYRSLYVFFSPFYVRSCVIGFQAHRLATAICSQFRCKVSCDSCDVAVTAILLQSRVQVTLHNMCKPVSDKTFLTFCKITSILKTLFGLHREASGRAWTDVCEAFSVPYELLFPMLSSFTGTVNFTFLGKVQAFL